MQPNAIRIAQVYCFWPIGDSSEQLAIFQAKLVQVASAVSTHVTVPRSHLELLKYIVAQRKVLRPPIVSWQTYCEWFAQYGISADAITKVTERFHEWGEILAFQGKTWTLSQHIIIDPMWLATFFKKVISVRYHSTSAGSSSSSSSSSASPSPTFSPATASIRASLKTLTLGLGLGLGKSKSVTPWTVSRSELEARLMQDDVKLPEEKLSFIFDLLEHQYRLIIPESAVMTAAPLSPPLSPPLPSPAISPPNTIPALTLPPAAAAAAATTMTPSPEATPTSSERDRSAIKSPIRKRLLAHSSSSSSSTGKLNDCMYIVPTFLQDMSQNEMEAEWSRHIIKHGSLLQPVLRPEQSSTTTTTTTTPTTNTTTTIAALCRKYFFPFEPASLFSRILVQLVDMQRHSNTTTTTTTTTNNNTATQVGGSGGQSWDDQVSSISILNLWKQGVIVSHVIGGTSRCLALVMLVDDPQLTFGVSLYMEFRGVGSQLLLARYHYIVSSLLTLWYRGILRCTAYRILVGFERPSGEQVWWKQNGVRALVVADRPICDPESEQPLDLVYLQPELVLTSVGGFVSAGPDDVTSSLSLSGSAGTKFENEKERFQREIEKLQTLGEGAFGVVWRCRWRGIEAAIKLVKLTTDNLHSIDSFCHEVSVLQVLRHPNIAQPLDFYPFPPSIVLELAKLGDLGRVLGSEEHLSWLVLVRMAREISAAIEYLHAQQPPIIHCDIKYDCHAPCELERAHATLVEYELTNYTSRLANVLVSSVCLEDQVLVKLGDMGNSRIGMGSEALTPLTDLTGFRGVLRALMRKGELCDGAAAMPPAFRELIESLSASHDTNEFSLRCSLYLFQSLHRRLRTIERDVMRANCIEFDARSQKRTREADEVDSDGEEHEAEELESAQVPTTTTTTMSTPALESVERVPPQQASSIVKRLVLLLLGLYLYLFGWLLSSSHQSVASLTQRPATSTESATVQAETKANQEVTPAPQPQAPPEPEWSYRSIIEALERACKAESLQDIQTLLARLKKHRQRGKKHRPLRKPIRQALLSVLVSCIQQHMHAYLDSVLAYGWLDIDEPVGTHEHLTLLDIAAANNRSLCIDVLLARQPQATQQALRLAAAHGHVRAIQQLVRYGVDLEAEASDSSTALHLALQSEANLEAAALLLELGAKITRPMWDNVGCQEMACTCISAILARYGRIAK